jgi:hypothetical protein
MSRERITNEDVWNQIIRLNQIRHELRLPPVTYYAGDKVNGVTNKLTGSDHTNMWSDAMAGRTKREAWNALRVMISTLSEVADHQENVRMARVRSGL